MRARLTLLHAFRTLRPLRTFPHARPLDFSSLYRYALTALDVSNNRFGDGGAEALAQELRTNPSLLFVRAAGNEIGPKGGAALASALVESVAMLDMTHNNAVGYADLMAVRLSNNRRAPGAPPSPLDGWSKAEND